MLKQLRIKFIAIIMAIVTVMLCVIFGLVIHFTQQNLEQESIQAMQQSGNDHRSQIGMKDSPPGEFRYPTFTLELSPGGELIARGSNLYDLSNTDVLHTLWDLVKSQEEQTGVLMDYNLRYLKTNRPGGSTYIFADITNERSTMNALWQSCVMIGIVCFLAMFGLSFLLSHWAVKPVATAWEQQRQFVADASHELKTPLTVIMTNAELLSDPKYDTPVKAQFAENIRQMSRQMRGLVEGLLELARADNGSVKVHFEPVDLSQAVWDAALPFEPIFFEKGLELDCRIQASVTVSGSLPHLKQVVEILLDNGLKYSATPGKVSLKLTRQGKTCLLEIATPGETISKADLANIFKRFYRIDSARSGSGSYGLGLSIAQRIVSDHGGRIWAQSENSINTFFVQLPCE